MGFRKTVKEDAVEGDGAIETGADVPSPDSAQAATAGIAADIVAEPPAIPEPIFATDDDGRDRPMSGGSFVRQPDGTLVRNPEA